MDRNLINRKVNVEDMNDLKVGDKVILNSHWNGKRIETVEAITKTGLIKVCGSLYYPDGRQRGGDAFSSSTIKKYNEEEGKVIEQNNYVKEVISKLRKLESLDYEKAVKIMEILEK